MLVSIYKIRSCTPVVPCPKISFYSLNGSVSNIMFNKQKKNKAWLYTGDLINMLMAGSCHAEVDGRCQLGGRAGRRWNRPIARRGGWRPPAPPFWGHQWIRNFVLPQKVVHTISLSWKLRIWWVFFKEFLLRGLEIYILCLNPPNYGLIPKNYFLSGRGL